ncbi:gamma-glutamyl-gamma-aminobutyrate hydrolase family protein [Marinivivus vitaminiproducens]|uniref:gamma-glutamyl-gamma-aminobutyrate hydrolase family protein n=1 Tax=Marinivivus vitaminiproducens TaxID=3035935 RepID=UPI0027AA64A6|nr:gamma-glutamyl-gamma-aminobutyrate hydrolase family protein [Geminicoccaceae bacterium SCSIO 64248]
MTQSAPPPLIGLPACHVGTGPFATHRVGEKYAEAVLLGAEGMPVIVPAFGQRLDIRALVDRLDGLMLTGSPSNVDPRHYDGPAFRKGTERDTDRDATTLPLIRAAIAAGCPLLAICRGFQELNVALGGSLHAYLHEVPGRFDHRSDKARPMDERYEPAHEVTLTAGGAFHAIQDTERLMVNSLHGQGIDRLAPSLAVEAVAADGTIEAVSVPDAPAFAIGVQWHPEWRVLDVFHHRRLFAAFGAASRMRAAMRTSDDRLRAVAARP